MSDRTNIVMTYRGDIQGLVARDNSLYFVSTHREKQGTALHRIEIDGSLNAAKSVKLSLAKLPSGAHDLVLLDKQIWIAGQDGKLYTSTLPLKKPQAVGKLNFGDNPVLRLQALAHDQLALLHKKQLTLLDTQSKTVKQTVDLHDNSTVMAADPQGQWLAVGFQNGDIAVYRLEDHQLQFSAKAQIHQGRVSALAFEANELRFYSAGADKKLYNTHAQGELQALDKGKSSNHNGVINHILTGETRFFTGASDKSIKAWAYAGGRPVSISKGLHKVKALAVFTVENRRFIAAACTDNSLRLMPLSSKDEPNDVQMSIRDGYAWAENCLRDTDIKENEEGLELLEEYDDQKSFDILTRYLSLSDKKPIRQQIIKIATASKHPASTQLLENGLTDKQHDVVRLAAYDGLVKRISKHSLRPYTLSLDTGFTDIGSKAIAALAKAAKKQPLAEQALINTLQHDNRHLCLLSLYHLESVYGKNDPKASLHALKVTQPELQRAAVIRLYQRDLLANNEVQRALLLVQDDGDAWVRQTAFLVFVLSQPALADTLKARDADLARQLQELEDFDLLKPDATTADKATKTKQTAASLLKKAKGILKSNDQDKPLTEQQLKPLLQGMASQHADICFKAGFALAVLQDQRAFGLLLLLSQENDAAIRIGVCRAFALLQQKDALQQLSFMLDDSKDTVRDAAFTAITTLEDGVWQQVQYGFTSRHEDIHTRALKSLLDALGKQKTLPDAGLALLQQALNAPFLGIRQETFKVSLNRQLGGDLPGTLRLLRSSQHENIHQEVLNETLAALKEDWAHALLLESFDDDFQSIRQEALKQALKEKKRFDRHHVLKQASASPFVDMRQAALEHIKTKPGSDDWQLVQTLLHDKHETLRQQAFAQIVKASDTTTLKTALDSPYEDTRVLAALTCAKLGMEEAYEPLRTLATAPKPSKKAERTTWKEHTQQALMGLANLQDDRAFDIALHHIQPEHEANLAEAASAMLPWVSNTDHIDQLLPLLNDERKIVRAQAALALALLEQESGQNALADTKTSTLLAEPLVIAASLSKPPVTTQRLRRWLENKSTQATSLILLFSHELLLHSDQPELTVRALSVDNPSLQRQCADLISRYHDDAARWQYFRHVFTQHLTLGDKPDWQIPLDHLKQLAAVLVHGTPHLRAHLLQVIAVLEKNIPLERWEQAFAIMTNRYADAFAAAEACGVHSQPAGDQQHQWQQLAFGAYLGLLRAEDRFDTYATDNLRVQAVNGLAQLAEQNDSNLKQGVFSCLLTLLNHEQYAIRHKAYDHLLALGLPLKELGQAATTSRHDDVATMGLNVLVKHYPIKQSRQLLQDMVVTGSAALAEESYDLLLKDKDAGLVSLAPFALKSYTPYVRRQTVWALGAAYDNDAAVAALLVDACQHQDRDIAVAALGTLAQHHYPQLLPLAENVWHSSEDAYEQNRLAHAISRWQGEGKAAFLLACANNRETLKTTRQQVLYMLGETRDTGVANDLLALIQQKAPDSRYIANALHTISGYDQYLAEDVDEDDASTDQSWLKHQFPRHDTILINLFSALVKTDQHSHAENLLEGMAWAAKSADLDTALAEAAAVANDDFLEDVVQTIAVRARRREGSVEALLKLLTHKDPDIQFLAAEGLGRSGHTQGNNVLLAASDYLDDVYQRQRAVIALGESGDSAVLDKLLEWAEDKEHALCEAATEAMGHLGQSNQAEKILKLLQQRLKQADAYSDMNEHALNGLRWFNTLDAWQTIADFVDDNQHDIDHRAHAIKLLRHWDSQRCRDLLLKLLRTSGDDELMEAAWDSARHLWQPADDAVSPIDLAVMQGNFQPDDVGDDKTLERVARYASTAQLLDLLAGHMGWRDDNPDWLDEDDIASMLQPLQQAIMQHNDLQTDDLVKGLSTERSDTLALIAHLVTLQAKPVKAIQTALAQALETRHTIWLQRWQNHERHADADTLQKRDKEQHTLSKLFHASIHQQVESPLLVECLQSNTVYAVVFHDAILNALLRVKTCTHTALLEAVAQLQTSTSLNVRQLAQQVTRQHSGTTAQGAWESFLHQPAVLSDQTFSSTLIAAAKGDQQARALPVLIRQQDSAALNAIAADDGMDEIQRMGAIEGLGRIRTEAAESHLQALSQQDGIDEDIGRAAFRALRRSQRAREKASLAANGQQGAAA